MEEETSIKIIVIGMEGSGKTNIIQAAINNPFQENNKSTLASSFISKKFTYGKKKYHIDIWDTAGQEKFKSLTKLFIVDSKIVIFVYDITQRKSFEELDHWIKIAKDALGDFPVYAIFGNKKDLYSEEEVAEGEGQKLAEEIDAYFKLTSAKTERESINEYIEELIKMFINKHNIFDRNNSETFHREESFTLQYTSNKKKKRGRCCEKT